MDVTMGGMFDMFSHFMGNSGKNQGGKDDML